METEIRIEYQRLSFLALWTVSDRSVDNLRGHVDKWRSCERRAGTFVAVSGAREHGYLFHVAHRKVVR